MSENSEKEVLLSQCKCADDRIKDAISILVGTLGTQLNHYSARSSFGKHIGECVEIVQLYIT